MPQKPALDQGVELEASLSHAVGDLLCSWTTHQLDPGELGRIGDGGDVQDLRRTGVRIHAHTSPAPARLAKSRLRPTSAQDADTFASAAGSAPAGLFNSAGVLAVVHSGLPPARRATSRWDGRGLATTFAETASDSPSENPRLSRRLGKDDERSGGQGRAHLIAIQRRPFDRDPGSLRRTSDVCPASGPVVATGEHQPLQTMSENERDSGGRVLEPGHRSRDHGTITHIVGILVDARVRVVQEIHGQPDRRDLGLPLNRSGHQTGHVLAEAHDLPSPVEIDASERSPGPHPADHGMGVALGQLSERRGVHDVPRVLGQDRVEGREGRPRRLDESDAAIIGVVPHGSKATFDRTSPERRPASDPTHVRMPAQRWCRDAVERMKRTTRLLVSVTS